MFAKSLLYTDVPGEESFRKHLLVGAHFVPRVCQTLTSEISAEGGWPLPTDFSCFLNWLKPTLTFRALSHKSYWPLAEILVTSRLRLWILGHMGNIAESSSRGLRIKMEACNIRQKSRKARQKAKWKMYHICFIFLYVGAWIHDRLNSSEGFCCLSRKNTLLLSNQLKSSMASPTSPSFSSQAMVQDMLVSAVLYDDIYAWQMAVILAKERENSQEHNYFDFISRHDLYPW